MQKNNALHYTMNETKLKPNDDEKISVDKPIKLGNNAFLSQNLTAVTPNRTNWLFLRLSTAQRGENAGVNPPYTNHAQSVRYSPMVWLILQNKPFGEYVKRYLLKPRVRPHRPTTGALTHNLTGVFA